MQPSVMMTEGEVSSDDLTPGDLACCQPQMPVLAELLCSELELELHHEENDNDDSGLGHQEDEEDDDSLMNIHHYPYRNSNYNNNVSRQQLFRQQEDLQQQQQQPQFDDGSVQSYFDPALLHHSEVLSRLKVLESRMEKPHDYFQNGATTKDEILPYMRKVVASWMLEVCEEQRCDEAVFPLAVAILDRFLATCSIKKENLQLVACVCLLLASKTRQCNHFSLDLLSWYTDNSVSPHSLRTWELMILSQLNWDVNVITATDFVDFLLVRTPGQPSQPNKNSLLIRRHAITFIALCSTEPRFVGLQPSLIAASAIFTALKGIKGRRGDSSLAAELAHMASVTEENLLSITSSIEQVISTEMAAIEQQTMDMNLPHTKTSSTIQIPCSASSSKMSSSSCGVSASCHNTPTDVQDIIV